MTYVRVLLLGALSVGCTETTAPEPEPYPDELTGWAPVRPSPGLPLFEAPARMVGTGTAAASVSMLAEGIVAGLFVRPGDSVDRGRPLVEVASPALARMAAEMVSLKKTLSIMRTRVERRQRLAEERIGSQDSLQSLLAELTRVESDLMELNGQLAAHGVGTAQAERLRRTGRWVLTSPIAGTVVAVQVELGHVVRPSTVPLIEIRGRGRPRIEARIPVPSTSGLELDFRASDGSSWAVRSEPLAVVPDPASGTFRAWFRLARPEQVMSEMVGFLAAQARGANVFEVPAQSILRDGSDLVVFRRDSGGTQDRVVVEILQRNDRSAVVRADLRSGDEVALDPVLLSDDGKAP